MASQHRFQAIKVLVLALGAVVVVGVLMIGALAWAWGDTKACQDASSSTLSRLRAHGCGSLEVLSARALLPTEYDSESGRFGVWFERKGQNSSDPAMILDLSHGVIREVVSREMADESVPKLGTSVSMFVTLADAYVAELPKGGVKPGFDVLQRSGKAFLLLRRHTFQRSLSDPEVTEERVFCVLGDRILGTYQGSSKYRWQ